MKEGTTVYHGTYGFGVVLSVNSDYGVTVQFDTGWSWTVPAGSLKLVFKDDGKVEGNG